MRIMLVHNYYQQPGGEDAVFADEKMLLEEAGHDVTVFHRNNEEIAQYTLPQKIRLGVNTIWARDSYSALKKIIGQEKPQVAHFHNTFPLISPAGYKAFSEVGVPIVQTLHNFRLICPAAILMRDGKVCELCVGKTLPWQSVRYGCYRDSSLQSGVVASMLTVHRGLKTWENQVSTYIALTEFSRKKFIQGGLPAEKIVVKPNFIYSDPGMRIGYEDFVLYAGRISIEKGLLTMLNAWDEISDIPLKIAGSGPYNDHIVEFIKEKNIQNIDLLGRLPFAELVELIKKARFIIMPSEWYEGFPRIIAEAFACGVPVIGSRLGAMEEIIVDGKNGIHFTPGDPIDLAEKVKWLWERQDIIKKLGQNARATYEGKYSPTVNYNILMNIYSDLVNKSYQSKAFQHMQNC